MMVAQSGLDYASLSRMGGMGSVELVLRRVGADGVNDVRSLLTEASRWLKTKNTDQWAVPWPDESGREERIKEAIDAGQTWIVWAGDLPAATLTASPDGSPAWSEESPDPAVYVRRIVVSRRYAGIGLGSQLIDWAGLHASHDYGARWIRVDVWTTNVKLHDYYRRQGFEYCGLSPVPHYPSAALFQRATDQLRSTGVPIFHEDPGPVTV